MLASVTLSVSRRLRPELLALHQTSMDVGTTASVSLSVSRRLRPELLAPHQTSMHGFSDIVSFPTVKAGAAGPKDTYIQWILQPCWLQ